MLTLNEESQQHRAAPVAFFKRVFDQLFGHHFTPDDAQRLWEGQLGTGMWYADDALFAFRHVVERGPDGLGALLREATSGRFSLVNHRPGLTDPTDDDYHDWLSEVVAGLETRFRERMKPEPEEDGSVVWADSPEAAAAEARAEVPFWARDVHTEVEDASSEYGPGAFRVRLDYVLPYR
jgi:hypothetical protein